MFMRRASFVAVLFLCAVVSASAVDPKLHSLTPVGGQLGSEVELNFEGERLQDTEEILAYEPGLKILKLDSVTNVAVKAQLKIEKDCALGEHHFRIRTASGFSELITFFVGPFPVVQEIEPNNDLQKPQKVELNTTVEGIIASEDVDCFVVEAKKGERLSAEVEGIRLGRSSIDARLAVYDSKGEQLADVDDTRLAMQDPFVSLVIPADGSYTIQLRDVTYGGSDKSFYHLHIGNYARPTSIFPLGGKIGEEVKFTFYSPATGEFTQVLKLPDEEQEKFGIFANFEGLQTPSANWVRVSPFPNVLAISPNEDREHATITDLPTPLALNGIIAAKHKTNWFRFPVVKGEALEFNVFARRLRSPLDSVIEVFDAAGKSLGSNDDSVGADSTLKITPSETTNYFVKIQDRLGDGGPEFAYRIEVGPAVPRLAVKIPEVARNDTQSRQFIPVPRGNRFATLISVKRANFSSPVHLTMDGLPKGMRMLAEEMTAGMDSMPLVFEADSDAPVAGKLLDLTAAGTNANGTVSGRFKQEVELVLGQPNNANYYSTTVEKLGVAVTKEVPFKLRVVEPQVPLVQSGSMPLEIVAERDAGFDEPIEVKMVWNPPGVSSQSEATIAKGATNVFYQLNASAGADTRSWKLALLGHATVEGGKVYVSTQFAPLEVAAPFLKGKIETTWLNPGKSAQLTVNLQQAKPFEGKAKIKLMGLPEKVSTASKEISKDDQEVVFDLQADAGCPATSIKNLFCSVEVPDNGQIITHNIASGGILRIVPPKKSDAKVASVEAKK
jgi:hypothetical protein